MPRAARSEYGDAYLEEYYGDDLASDEYDSNGLPYYFDDDD